MTPLLISSQELFLPRDGVKENDRDSVPILKATYKDFCCALFFLQTDWLAKKIGIGPPRDEWELRKVKEIIKLSGEYEGTIKDQPEVVQQVYHKLVELKAPGHLRIVTSHRHWIRQSHRLCVIIGVKFSDKMADLVQRHDLSKYSHKEVLGYAIMFGEGSEDFRHLETELEKLEWDTSLNNHYIHNPHHPEYFYDVDKTGKRIKTKSILELDPENGVDFLLESIIDMMASRGERTLAKDPVISVKKILDMPDRYLMRYHEDDAKFVRQTMEEWSLMAQKFLQRPENAGKLDGLFDSRKVTYE